MAKDKNGKELPKGIAQRKDGLYMGRFTHNGEAYCLYSKSVKKLEKDLNNLRYEVEHGLYAKETNVSFDSWFKTWIEEYKPLTVKRGTLIVYQNAYDLYIKDKFAKKKLKDIRAEHIQKLYNELNKTYSRSVLLSVSQVINGMFKQAIENGMLVKNPAEHIKKPKQYSESVKEVMTKEQQDIFVKALEGSRLRILIKVALFTGLRSGELRGLQWEDIDFKNSLIHVNHTLKYVAKEGFFLDQPKTKTSKRDVPMLEEVAILLKKQRQQQNITRIALGQRYMPVDGLESLVFTTEKGRPLQGGSIDAELKRICKGIQGMHPGFPEISPHSLRHTFATRGIENGMQLKVMQTILGHSTLAMTSDLYSHVLPDIKAQEMRKIQGLF
ncbi:site-specific integrase [Lactonifactor longoviformis]|uniref:tyrosine-type recombinase/integrase n=1 Tax=Lactonifactor longoviformis TaxID=341220 RepID=UPI00210BA238|nr:site-specific integrase [Lactonifactor longoviformis]MCQ4672450.1 site-specific integrase [Lactonifactor longoviformis]